MTATEAVAPDDQQLASALPLLRETLARIADETRHTMVVTDATGRVLWWDGRRLPGVPVQHRWTSAACPVHDPDAGAVIGAVDVDAPALHPTTPALIIAAAGLAESLLFAQQAVRDELMRARYLGLLDRLHGPAALLSPSGRVLAGRPADALPARMPVPEDRRITFSATGRAVLTPLPGGWLLRAC